MDNTKLDLRYNGKLSSELCQLFTKISYDLRGGFNDLIAELSEPNKNNLDWWVQSPASRNTYSSSLFHYYCCLHLVRHLIDNKKIKFRFIIVDSRIMKSYIDELLSDHGINYCKVVCTRSYVSCIKYRIRTDLVLIVLFLKKIIQWLVSRRTSKNISSGIKDIPIVLIDTFMLAGHTTEDRWYGELWNNLEKEQKEETYFVPTIVMTPLRSMYSTYLSLRDSERNFLIKEDYLKLKDIVEAFKYRKRLRKITIKPLKVLGLDISSLVWEEVYGSRDVLTTIESILVYYFVRQLSKSGVKVRLAIDWFEGQAIDKAWNLAFKVYYPETKRIGYRALEGLPFYLCSYPIKIERDAGVVPDLMGVQSRASEKLVREFLPDLNVVVVPSFRSTHVWNESTENQKTSKQYTILVTLPISIHASVRILKGLIEVYDGADVSIENIRYIVKPHPTVTIEQIKKSLLLDLPDLFNISKEKSFPKLLRNSDLLITEASNTCLEAMAWGIPVIIIENKDGLTNDPVPKSIADPLCNRVDSSSKLSEAIKQHANSSREDLERNKKCGLAIREYFFEPITKSGIKKFLNVVAK